MVQGVGFRYWTMARARELRLGGFVRNLPDGSVEARISGPDRSVDRMVEFLSEGPGHSIVEELEEIERKPVEEPFMDFIIIR